MKGKLRLVKILMYFLLLVFAMEACIVRKGGCVYVGDTNQREPVFNYAYDVSKNSHSVNLLYGLTLDSIGNGGIKCSGISAHSTPRVRGKYLGVGADMVNWNGNFYYYPGLSYVYLAHFSKKDIFTMIYSVSVYYDFLVKNSMGRAAIGATTGPLAFQLGFSSSLNNKSFNYVGSPHVYFGVSLTLGRHLTKGYFK